MEHLLPGIPRHCTYIWDNKCISLWELTEMPEDHRSACQWREEESARSWQMTEWYAVSRTLSALQKSSLKCFCVGWEELLLFICLVMSNSLWPHGMQHDSLLCPLLFPRVCSNSCPLMHWFHQTISSSVVPFSACPQTLSASGSFLMSWLFTSGGQSIGTSASVLPVNIRG